MPEPLTKAEVQAWLESSPFIKFMGLSVESLDVKAGTLALRAPMRAEFERLPGSGQWHGGPIAAFIDTVGDFVVAAIARAPVPTINFRVDYLRPCTGPFLIGRATLRRLGRTVGVVDIDVLDEQNRLCAVGRGTYGAQAG